MKVSPDSPLSSQYVCHDCGSEIGFRSRRRTLMEWIILPLFLVRPVRCGECFRRDYRLIFTEVRDRLPETKKLRSLKAKPAPNRNVA